MHISTKYNPINRTISGVWDGWFYWVLGGCFVGFWGLFLLGFFTLHLYMTKIGKDFVFSLNFLFFLRNGQSHVPYSCSFWVSHSGQFTAVESDDSTTFGGSRRVPPTKRQAFGPPSFLPTVKKRDK